MKAILLNQIRAMFPVGAIVECVENTYIPARAGTRRTIRKAGKSYLDAEMDGKPYRMALPQRVCDVLALSADTVKFNLRGPRDPERLEGHTVTYRVIGGTP